MRPYPGNLENEQRVSTFRLSRARQCIENSSGIMMQRFWVLKSELNMDPQNEKTIENGLWSGLEKLGPLYHTMVPYSGGHIKWRESNLLIWYGLPLSSERNQKKNTLNYGVGAIPAQWDDVHPFLSVSCTSLLNIVHSTSNVNIVNTFVSLFSYIANTSLFNLGKYLKYSIELSLLYSIL